MISGVLALRRFASFRFGTSVDPYLLDATAVAAAGQTVADVTEVKFSAYIDHDPGVTVPAREPRPALNLIEGTDCGAGTATTG